MESKAKQNQAQADQGRQGLFKDYGEGHTCENNQSRAGKTMRQAWYTWGREHDEWQEECKTGFQNKTGNTRPDTQNKNHFQRKSMIMINDEVNWPCVVSPGADSSHPDPHFSLRWDRFVFVPIWTHGMKAVNSEQGGGYLGRAAPLESRVGNKYKNWQSHGTLKLRIGFQWRI